jgi:UDP-2-acetamido-2-deoxy-ribo-hexuluronate aminotransferase
MSLAALGSDTRISFRGQSGTIARCWPLLRTAMEQVSDGRQVGRLERALARRTGARHVLGVNGAADGLVLLLLAGGLRPGDGVLTPAFGSAVAADAVALAGGVPRFVDVDPVSYAIDPAALDRALTPDCRFVLVSHPFSGMALVSEIAAIARRNDLVVLEECAPGLRRNGRHAGRHGLGGAMSLAPGTVLGALGDAAVVLTEHAEIADRVAELAGRNPIPGQPGIVRGFAVPSVLDDIQAAVLLTELRHLESVISRRAELAALYRTELRDAPGITRLPSSPQFGWRDRDVFSQFVLEHVSRDELAVLLAEHGIETECPEPVPAHLRECFADLGHRPGDFPHAESAARHTLALPLHPDLTDREARRVSAVIREAGRG